jgi:hypothetical protein
MGYTHYWSSTNDQKSAAGYLTAFPTISDIVKRYRKIIQFECDNAMPPVVDGTVVRFNGIEDEGHETFSFVLGRDDFCKTARKPYDLPVCECLLVLNEFIPSMVLKSDGFGNSPEDIDDEWKLALQNVNKVYGLNVIIE